MGDTLHIGVFMKDCRKRRGHLLNSVFCVEPTITTTAATNIELTKTTMVTKRTTKRTTLIPTTTSIRKDCPIGIGWSLFGGNCFKFFDTAVPFTEADAKCEENGASLT